MPPAQGESLREAVDRTREALGTDAYLLIEGEERHFLAEAALTALASTVLTASLKGLVASAEGRAEQRGREVGAWVLDRAERVLGLGQDPELEAAAAEAQAAGGDPDAAEAALAAGLREEGFLAEAAERVAAAARAAAT